MNSSKILIPFLLASLAGTSATASVESGLTAKWQAYVDIFGFPGADGAVQRTDLFIPAIQGPETLTYFNLRQEVHEDGLSGHSAGLGLRHMLGEQVLGIYGFLDWRETDFSGDYMQYSAGAELLHEYWEVRFNGYWPDETTTRDIDSQIVADAGRQDIFVLAHGERNLSGYDGEIGARLFQSDEIDLVGNGLFSASSMDFWAYAGGYGYVGEDDFDDVTGFRGRLEVGFDDLAFVGTGSRLSLGVEGRYDDEREEEIAGWVRLRIPFGTNSDSGAEGSEATSQMSLDRRMVAPVVRWPEEVTSTAAVRVEALNPSGVAYSRYLEAHSREELEAQTGSRTSADEVVFINMISGGANWEMTDFVSAGGGVIYAAAGKSAQIGFISPFSSARHTLAFTPQGTTPWLDFDADASQFDQEEVEVDEEEIMVPETAFQLSAGDHINGWEVDATGYQHGLLIEAEGQYWISNSTFRSAFEDGLRVENGANITVFDNAGFFDNGDDGIDARGETTQITVENSESSYNGDDGFYAKRAEIVEVADSDFIGNGYNGISVEDGDTHLTINNSDLLRNEVYGLSVSEIKVATISKTDFKYNPYGGIVLDDEDGEMHVNISNSEASHNGDNGLYASGPAIVKIINSDFIGNEYHGVSVEDGDTFLSIENSNMSYNDVNGLFVSAIKEVYIDDSVFKNNLADGVHISNEAGAGELIVTIDNSIFTENKDDGIDVSGEEEYLYLNLTITNSDSSHNNEDGIYLSDFTSADIRDSTFNQNGEDGLYARDGGRLEVHDTVVTGNDWNGIHLKRVNDVKIAGSDISYSLQHGIYVENGSNVTDLSNTTISHNAGHGIFAVALNNAVDPEDNEDSEYAHDPVVINATNISVFGNGGAGVFNAGGQVTVNSSQVNNNDGGDYFDQIGVLEEDGDQFCIRNDGFIDVDGVRVTQVEITPIPADADCAGNP